MSSTQASLYEGGTPSQKKLNEQAEKTRSEHKEALGRVDALVKEHKGISEELRDELAAMREQGAMLDELEAEARQTGIVASLSRMFNRRQTILQRKSVADSLLSRYEAVSQRLRRASAFSDELRLCALELQQEVDRLHEDLARAKRNHKAAAERVLHLDSDLSAIESDAAMSADDRARQLDRLTFEQRTESTALELFRAQVGLCEQELGPARGLRDMVLDLHEEMADFVLKATSAGNTAGRKIQALGMAADAPTVVAELSQSLGELGQAMQITEQYIEQAQHLLTSVLPDLNDRIAADSQSSNLLLTDDLNSLSRDRARELADRALRDAAEAEVERALAEVEDA